MEKKTVISREFYSLDLVTLDLVMLWLYKSILYTRRYWLLVNGTTLNWTKQRSYCVAITNLRVSVFIHFQLSVHVHSFYNFTYVGFKDNINCSAAFKVQNLKCALSTLFY